MSSGSGGMSGDEWFPYSRLNLFKTRGQVTNANPPFADRTGKAKIFASENEIQPALEPSPKIELTPGANLLSRATLSRNTPLIPEPGMIGNPVWRSRMIGWSIAPTLAPAPT
jgi:hypothetical protein